MTLTLVLNQNLRAIVTVIFAFTFCFAFAAGRISESAFVGIAGSVISFWFGTGRDQKRATDTNGNGHGG